MMQGLKKNDRLLVKHGADGRLLSFLKTYFKYKPDYIHVDWTNKYFNRRKNWMVYFNIPILFIELFILTKLTPVKLVWTMHNLTPHDTDDVGPKFFARRLIAKSFTWIRVFDESTAEKAADLYNIKRSTFKILPEGSYLEYYKNNSTRDIARGKFNFSDTETVFLFVGLIRPYKGILEAIEQIKKVKELNWKLLIAGRCNQPDYLKKVIAAIEGDSRFILHEGFVPAEDLHFYFNASDYVLLPFKNIENSGSAILSMGFKKIVIAPQKGVLKRRLTNQLNFLYKESFIEVLEEIKKTSPEERSAIGEKNYEELGKYKWEDFAEFFLATTP